MSRKKLIRDLKEYQVKYPQEISLVNRVIAFIKNTPECFSRSHAEGHITGSAWLVNNHQQVLLTYHKKLHKWIQLGGHADGNPSVLNVALKEAEEESGILDLKLISDAVFDVDIHLIPANSRESSHYHYDIRYLISAGDMKQFKISNESISMAWIDFKDIKSYSKESSLLKMKEKYHQYQN
ncbi:MAG: NUDIX hydrolase [Deltaproteobacteria bacterium]|jgi:8-oxo-dGTP pyrophosphatase MutT (NUDIX family)|nr:NUDIX hydrolase [Deltaproteobacteria bacterium]MBT4526249.1 NUDIX hydrolase [Deltaproteobacteria bacterium]